jgi:pyruvate dehydrogenase E1 component alpha subunit
MDLKNGNLGANGIVGGGLGLALGAAFKMHYHKEENVVMCFLGDGATNEGLFHEALNLASIKNLPVVFFVENNHYAVSMNTSRSMKVTDIGQRANAYGIRSIILDGNDAIDVYNMTFSAVQYVREGNGPILIESKTYRVAGHSKSDVKQLYRSQEEVDAWVAKDPIKRLEEYILKNNIANSEMLKEINTRVMDEIREAVLFAQNSLDPSADILNKHIYAK